MKAQHFPLIFIILLILGTYNANAAHPIGDDDCVAQLNNGKLLKIEILNSRPVTPHVIQDPDNFTSGNYNYVNFKSARVGLDESEQPNESFALVLKTTEQNNIFKSFIDDGCFVGEAYSEDRSTVVESVTSKISEQYGIQKDQIIQFQCTSSTQFPIGKHCNK